MPTRQEVYAAILDADRKGDTNAVRQLSQYLKTMKGSDTSALTGFVGGVLKPFDKAVELAHNVPILGDALRAGDELGTHIGLPNAQEAIARNDEARANNTRTGWQTVGNIVGTAPLAVATIEGAPYASAAIQGAASGALLSDKHDVGGIAQDAALGGIAGTAGTAAVRGVSNVASPIVDKGVRALHEAKVPLTFGQLAESTDTLTGKVLGGVEDRLAGLPIVGSLVQSARDRGRDAYNRAVLNRVVNTVGVQLPDEVPIGTEGIKYVGDMLSGHYEALLPKLSMKADRPFAIDFRNAEDLIKTVPNEVQGQFHSMVTSAFQNRVNNGTLSGDALKQAESMLTKHINSYRSGTVNEQKLAEALTVVRQGLRDAVERQNPAYGPQLQNLREGWRELAIVEKAAGTRRNNATGVFTPGEYRGAAKSSDPTVRRRATARGTAANQELTNAAVNFLDNSTPDSGTAGRMAVWDMAKSVLAGGAGAGAAVAAPQASLGGVAALSLAALPYTRMGQHALNEAWLAPRGPLTTLSADALRALPVGAPSAALAAPRKKRR